MEQEGRRDAADQQIEQELAGTKDVRHYRRLLAVRAYESGKSVNEISALLNVSRQSVYNWLERYQQSSQVAALEDLPRGGRPPKWTPVMDQQLQQLMSDRPDVYGYLAPTWTVPLLQRHFQQTCGTLFADETIRRALHRLGYVWKRYRYVLEPDPDVEKKTLDSGANRRFTAPQCAVGGR